VAADAAHHHGAVLAQGLLGPERIHETQLTELHATTATEVLGRLEAVVQTQTGELGGHWAISSWSVSPVGIDHPVLDESDDQ
jgi:hypothetical protein